MLREKLVHLPCVPFLKFRNWPPPSSDSASLCIDKSPPLSSRLRAACPRQILNPTVSATCVVAVAWSLSGGVSAPHSPDPLLTRVAKYRSSALKMCSRINHTKTRALTRDGLAILLPTRIPLMFRSFLQYGSQITDFFCRSCYNVCIRRKESPVTG